MNRPLATRKHGAPGASPLAQQQNFNSAPYTGVPDQNTYDQSFNDWSSANGLNNLNNGFLGDTSLDNGGFDGGLNGAANFGTAGVGQLGNEFTDGQLGKRGQNQQVVAANPNSWQDAEGSAQPVPSFEQVVDEDDDLEQKAQAAKKEAQSKRKQIPPFVQKLSSFLDNNQNTDLIRWSDNGDSFIVIDEDEFARKLIPELFKHNNYASFVRQLNMYGFHKKVGLSDNSMKASENKRKTPSEYYNKYFRRGRSELLWLIQKPKNPPNAKRKRDDKSQDSDDEPRPTPAPTVPTQGNAGADGNNTDLAVLPRTELQRLRSELQSLQQNQKVITTVIQQMKQQNDNFYRQATAFQDMHQRHENSINAILTFLATFYNRSLEGQSNVNELFNPSLPQGNVQPGNIVDIGELPEEMQMPARRRRQQLLLLAPEARATAEIPQPPANLQPARSTVSPQARNATQFRNTASASTTPNPPPSAPSPTVKHEADSPSLADNQDIMSVINAANSASPQTAATGLDFDSALHHFQNSDGNTPLTQQQRNDVLSLMQATMGTAGGGKSNALSNPQTPPMPSLNEIQTHNDQLNYLQRLTEQQNKSVEDLRGRIHSLSPSGYFPSLENNANPPPDFNLDDWMLPPPEGDFGNVNFDDFGNATGNGAFDANSMDGLNLNGAHEQEPQFDGNGAGFLSPEQPNVYQGGKVESISSRATTASPREPLKDGDGVNSPRKRRRAQ